jgi:HSP20 family molecular chaperone IbpA
MMYSNYYFATPKTCCVPKQEANPSKDKTFRPRLNIRHTENDIVLEFAMAGVHKEDIKLKIQDQVLILEAARRMNAEPSSYHHQEFGAVSYETMQANFQNGILKLVIGLKKKANIQVEVK